jgi:streptogramin lyase
MIRELLTTLVLLTALHLGAAQSRADLLFVTNSATDTGDTPNVTKFDAGGNPTVFATTGIGIPSGLAFDSAGNLYVANETGNAIRKFSPAGVDLGNFATTGLNGPEGLAFDSAGNLYVANAGSNTVRRFSPAGVDLGDFATTGLNFPSGLAFDSAGNLYVTNANNTVNTVRKFSPSGVDLGNFATTGLNGPEGLAFDSAGNLYVANNEAANIRRFSPTGVDLGDFVITPFLDGAGGLAFDSAGNLYVAIRANRLVDTIRKFSPAGVDLGNFATYPAVDGPAFLAFVPPTPFADFTAKLDLRVGPSASQDVFDMNGTFTLGASSDGIAPLTEPVSLALAGGTDAVTITIPAGSFTTTGKGAFAFQGTIDGVALQVQVRPVRNRFSVKAQGTGADLTGVANPVTVTLTIGEDSGTTTVIAQIQ